MVKRLIAEHVCCKEETDKWGSDDIYIFNFRGNTITTFDTNIIVHGPGEFWDAFDSNDDWSQDIPISKFIPSSLYFVQSNSKKNVMNTNNTNILNYM
jgi:hypothetical protein